MKRVIVDLHNYLVYEQADGQANLAAVKLNLANIFYKKHFTCNIYVKYEQKY